MANHLLNETSQYLLQHAHNPVDWRPWSDQALREAREEDKPIFLSIGYSACHWCHVMAHESFEDPAVASFLNDHFISIKVDREERPDLDRIYMAAVQSITGQGGWPLSAFLTPEGEPFFGGTYFPPMPRPGLPAFIDLLRLIAQAWEQRRDEVLREGRQMMEALKKQYQAPDRQEGTSLQTATLHEAYEKLEREFDRENGGWGQAPKFPQPMVLEFLLRYYNTEREPQALTMVVRTLESMARGGIYDQIGGGFHRYSVNENWSVPHFEKMLYDNAQLARIYLHTWQLTGLTFFRTIAEEILDYVAREMRTSDGGFASSQDADSEGEEGKFYLWTTDEIRKILGNDADSFLIAHGVSGRDPSQARFVIKYTAGLDDRPTHAAYREKLLRIRGERVKPTRDDMVIVSWNGLMLAAFAEAGRALHRNDFKEMALCNAELLAAELQTAEGRISHSWTTGTVGIEGVLDDYANLSEGFIELYQTTFDERWILAAHQLATTVVGHFSAPGGGFFDTADDAEALIVRPRGLEDTSTPSGNAMAVYVLLRMAEFLGEPNYSTLAAASLGAIQPLLSKNPRSFAQWLISLHYAVSNHRTVVVVGDINDPTIQAVIETANTENRPLTLVGLRSPSDNAPITAFLRGKEAVDGGSTVYVCAGSICQPPITDPSQFSAALDGDCQ